MENCHVSCAGLDFPDILSREKMQTFYSEVRDLTFAAQVGETRQRLRSHLQQIQSYPDFGAIRDQYPQSSRSRAAKINKEVQFFMFLDYVFLAEAEPVLPETDENGEVIQRNYLKEAEKIMPHISSSDLEDHTLHAKLYYCEIKASDLLMDLNDVAYRQIKKLFKTAKECFLNCKDDFNCYSAKLYIQTNYFAAMWNSGEVEAVNAAIVTLNDLFENYPEYQNEPSVRRHSAVYYSYLLGREFTMGNVEKTEYYADKMAESYGDAFVGMIATQYKEFVRVSQPRDEENELNMERVKSSMIRIENQWENMGGSKKMFRYHVVLIHTLYCMFKLASDDKQKLEYSRKLMEIFEEKCFKTALGTTEFPNLDIFEIYLKVCSETKQYQRMINTCSVFYKNRSKFKIPLQYQEIFDLIRAVALCLQISSKEFPNYVKSEPRVIKLKRQLREASTGFVRNGKKFYWHEQGLQFLFDFHKVTETMTMYKKFRQSTDYELPSVVDKCSLIETGSNKSSLTSLTEIVEIEMSSLKVIIIDSINSVNPNLLDDVLKKLSSSFDQLIETFDFKLNVPLVQINNKQIIDEPLKFNDLLLDKDSGCPAIMLMVRQVSETQGSMNCMALTEVHKCISRVLPSSPKMLWIVMETVVIDVLGFNDAPTQNEGNLGKQASKDVVFDSFVDAIFTLSISRVSFSDFISEERKTFADAISASLIETSRQRATVDIMELVLSAKKSINDKKEQYICEAEDVDSYTTDGKIYCLKFT